MRKEIREAARRYLSLVQLVVALVSVRVAYRCRAPRRFIDRLLEVISKLPRYGL